MKKLLFIAAALAAGASHLQAEDLSFKQVELKMNAPSEVTAGEAFTVQLSIINNGATGFARFHADLPKGFAAEEVEGETADATFSFDEQRVRFVWATLPEAPELNFSYRIRVTDPRLKGNLQLSGRFTYIVGADRQAEEAEVSVTVAPSPQVAAAQAIDIEAYQAEDVQPWSEALQAAQPVEAPQGSATGADAPTFTATAESGRGSASVFAVRQKPYMVDNEYYVNIQITKALLSGSGRVDETLSFPVSKIEAVETKGALFQIDDSRSKISFVWTELPQDTGSFVIAYKVIPWQGAAQLAVQGLFTYSDSEGEKNIRIVEREVDFSVHVPVPPLAAASQAVEAPAAPKKVSQPTQRGLVFKVQLQATRRPLQNFEAYFRQYGVTDHVVEEKLDANAQPYIYKYVVGPFKRYEQAQSKRDQVWRKGITDAFVTCYYNGDRITIQEALMISSKKR
ncbi:MAG: hypothetical protein LBT94_00095 [Prevotellaceae bacterium]|jgi:hypothetical protein|nr:hypothetical protein [Prevotellaceae bacterium]